MLTVVRMIISTRGRETPKNLPIKNNNYHDNICSAALQCKLILATMIKHKLVVSTGSVKRLS